MSDVTISYNNTKISDLSISGKKTLTTAGTYCEGNVEVAYTPKSRTYDLALARASGWVFLTTLDTDVLEHINDSSLIVSLINLSDYVYDSYSLSFAIASNTSTNVATANKYPVYGVFAKQSNETNTSFEATYYPANKTDTSLTLGNSAFRIDNTKYYIHPSDGYVRAGNYKLIFTW